MTIEQRYSQVRDQAAHTMFVRGGGLNDKTYGEIVDQVLDAINFRAYLKMEEAARKCKPGYLHPDIVMALAELDDAK